MGARIQERPGSKFYVIINHGGKRIARYTGKGKVGKKAAETAAAIITGRLKAGDLGVLEKKPAQPEPQRVPTFGECAALWPDWHDKVFKKRRPNTVRNAAAAIRSFADFKDLPVSEMTQAVIEDYIARRRGVLGDQTIRVYLTACKGILDFAVRRGHIPANPMRLGPIWRPEGGPGPDPFAHGELSSILEAAEAIAPALALMLRCWAQSGMRSGEVRALRRSDLDPARGVVVVERTLDHGGRFAPVKTKGSVRSASILYPTCEATASWTPGSTPESRAVLAALARVVPLDPAAPLFPSLKDPAAFMRDTEALKLWDEVVEKAGVRRRVAETLRHTFVSTMLSRGCPPLALTRQTGHSPAVMFKHYAAFIEQAPPSATQAQPVGGHALRGANLGRAGNSIL